MSDEPIQLDTIVVQSREVQLRKVPGGPDRMFVQADGTGNVLVDFADGKNPWGDIRDLNEAQYEELRKEAFRKELADLEDIPTYAELYPPPGKGGGGASTTPNGNTQGRVNGEAPATGKSADDSNAEVESETPAEDDTGDKILDGLQLGLDVVGLIPVVGEIADLANAGISLARGDVAGAVLSLASAIPFAGWLGTAGKAGRHGAKAAAEAADKAAKEAAERAAKEAADKAAKEGSEQAAKRADDAASKGKDGAKVNDNVVRDGSHLGPDGRPKPDSKYKTGEHEYIYETDSLGRIKEVKADDLKLTTRESRLPHSANSPGKLDGDHAGHLIGDRFGGSPRLDNIVSQSSSTNLSSYKKLENQWAKAIQEGKKVSVKITPNYSGTSPRPSSFTVEQVINGTKKVTRLRN
ncbi:TPA: DNA/RNA non-specific endonuclease [Pseudomonas aeruginosa]|nr:DNA/RNA non-specific endonuclease [Pseudomonas aeruginosa]HBO3041044.1 DNA/RNA non-specific endonuclease [Pseudomonas aeruginosa]